MAKKSKPVGAPLVGAPAPIVITLTIYPPNNGKRRIDVAAAPQGEMPSLMVGDFADRHVLLDSVYAHIIKRPAQLVKRPAESLKPKDSEPDEAILEAEEGESVGAGLVPAPVDAPDDAPADSAIVPPADLPAIVTPPTTPDTTPDETQLELEME